MESKRYMNFIDPYWNWVLCIGTNTEYMVRRLHKFIYCSTYQNNLMSDALIVPALKERRLLVLENLYDTYSATLYSLIFNVINDKAIAEEIFITIFVQLTGESFLFETGHLILPDLMKYVYVNTISYLNENQLEPSRPQANGAKLMHFLCSSCTSLKDVAYILNIPEEQAKKRLRSESLSLRENR